MKTYKHLYVGLCSTENLLKAFMKAKKGKSKKPYVIKFEANLQSNLETLQGELLSNNYRPRKLKQFIVRDPKTRKISKSYFRDRIVHHALCNVIGPILEKTFIYDSYASRKGKGQHKAIIRFYPFLRKVTNNGNRLKGIDDNNYISGYCLKCDVLKYFENINHKILLELIQARIKDKEVIMLIKKILQNYSNSGRKGMPLGNYTSQFFANFYLNELDYFIKHILGAKYYIRYVDDFVILHKSKKQLGIWKEKIESFLKKGLDLHLHSEKSKIISLHKGIKFLGFRIFYYYNLLNKSNLNQIRKNISFWKIKYSEQLMSYEKIIMKLEGWIAHAKNGNTFNFRKKILINFNEIFSLSCSKSP